MGTHIWKRVTMKFAIIAVVVVAVSSQVFGQLDLDGLDPVMVKNSEDLLLKVVRRTNDFIDNLPDMQTTGRQMGDLWTIAHPQLRTLLAKAEAWANQVPVPKGAGSPVTTYQNSGQQYKNNVRHSQWPGGYITSSSGPTDSYQGNPAWFPNFQFSK